MKNENYKILIVDDNTKNIQILANLLSENKYSIEYALNGPDALNLINIVNFDLVLLDIMMPAMDGFEVCNRIKKQPKNNEIPIIFLTAKTDRDSIKRAFKNGGNDYVSKPFDSDELLARVKTHIELKAGKDKLNKVNILLEQKVEERTNELKIANHKLLELDNAKSQFLQIISHEIRTPLNAILGSLSILKDGDIDEDSAMFIEMLDKSASRLEAFSYKALDISQFHLYGKDVLRLQKLSVQKLLDETILSLKANIEDKNISVIKTSNTNHDILDLDHDFFYKTIYNILHNAVSFSPKNEKIKIEIYKDENTLSIKIQDKGDGFDKEFSIKNISAFDSKYHIDSNPGLSLFLCNQIITAHGGKIENGNNNDAGAFVNLIMPV